MTLALYRAVTTLAAPLIHIYLARRRRAGREDAERFGERLGIASLPRPAGKLVWIHAASVGESLSMLALIERLARERPELNLLVTTGTVTSARMLASRLPSGVPHQYFPVDRLRWVRRFMDHWRPDLALWVESEFWRNMVSEIGTRNIPALLVNARISPRSYAGWRRAPRSIRRLLANFDLCLAQSAEDRDKLLALGAANVRAPGNLKFAAAPLPADDDELRRLRDGCGARPRWLAASTHPGEEDTVAAAHEALAAGHGGLVTFIAPRHPGRGPEIAAALRKRGLVVALRSAGEALAPDTEIYVADTMGELGLFYRLVPVVFMGGSLIPHGGQNLLEPAKIGCAIVHGPHMTNFDAITAEMQAAGATMVAGDKDTVAIEIGRLLGDETLRAARIAAAARVAAGTGGILDAFMAELAPYLDALAAPEGADADTPPCHARA